MMGRARKRVGGTLARIAIVTALALIATGLRTAPAVAAPGATNPITYLYDEARRLVPAAGPTPSAHPHGRAPGTSPPSPRVLTVPGSLAPPISSVSAATPPPGDPLTSTGTNFPPDPAK